MFKFFTQKKWFLWSIFGSLFILISTLFFTIFTFIAWFIYVITLIGIKFFNFPTKFATRSLFIAMWAVLGAYYMNSYIIGL